jgi:hypothetical protein
MDLNTCPPSSHSPQAEPPSTPIQHDSAQSTPEGALLIDPDAGSPACIPETVDMALVSPIKVLPNNNLLREFVDSPCQLLHGNSPPGERILCTPFIQCKGNLSSNQKAPGSLVEAWATPEELDED